MFWLDTAMFGETKVTKKQELIVEKQFSGLNSTGCLKLTGVCIFVQTALRSNQLPFFRIWAVGEMGFRGNRTLIRLTVLQNFGLLEQWHGMKVIGDRKSFLTLLPNSSRSSMGSSVFQTHTETSS